MWGQEKTLLRWKKLQQFLLLMGLMKEQKREGWREWSLWTCRKVFSPGEGSGRDVGTNAVGGCLCDLLLLSQ